MALPASQTWTLGGSEPGEDVPNRKVLCKPRSADTSGSSQCSAHLELRRISETRSLPKRWARTQLPFPRCMCRVDCGRGQDTGGSIWVGRAGMLGWRPRMSDCGDERPGMLGRREECGGRRGWMSGRRAGMSGPSRAAWEPRAGMPGRRRAKAGRKGWNVGLEGWNAGGETGRQDGAWECRNVQSMVFLSSVGMLSCRGCPILWMIPCCLFEPPPSRYNFLNIQSMFSSLILLSLWILLCTPWSGFLHVLSNYLPF